MSDVAAITQLVQKRQVLKNEIAKIIVGQEEVACGARATFEDREIGSIAFNSRKRLTPTKPLKDFQKTNQRCHHTCASFPCMRLSLLLVDGDGNFDE